MFLVISFYKKKYLDKEKRTSSQLDEEKTISSQYKIIDNQDFWYTHHKH